MQEHRYFREALVDTKGERQNRVGDQVAAISCGGDKLDIFSLQTVGEADRTKQSASAPWMADN